ncbi:hypothetical protein M9H77_28382 [Catharanthus roseus]|uniref:Uncharacterized protein n=1 Tax=Catharanthus roseus TaxID=4058 RepID=A0ACC0AFL3_CATRO|nr:hypothetical protein M9H77_28382 [Catharanthus roseus]
MSKSRITGAQMFPIMIPGLGLTKRRPVLISWAKMPGGTSDYQIRTTAVSKPEKLQPFAVICRQLLLRNLSDSTICLTSRVHFSRFTRTVEFCESGLAKSSITVLDFLYVLKLLFLSGYILSLLYCYWYLLKKLKPKPGLSPIETPSIYLLLSVCGAIAHPVLLVDLLKMKAVLVQNNIAHAICSPNNYPKFWNGEILAEKLGDAISLSLCN